MDDSLAKKNKLVFILTALCVVGAVGSISLDSGNKSHPEILISAIFVGITLLSITAIFSLIKKFEKYARYAICISYYASAFFVLGFVAPESQYADTLIVFVGLGILILYEDVKIAILSGILGGIVINLAYIVYRTTTYKTANASVIFTLNLYYILTTIFFVISNYSTSIIKQKSEKKSKEIYNNNNQIVSLLNSIKTSSNTLNNVTATVKENINNIENASEDITNATTEMTREMQIGTENVKDTNSSILTIKNNISNIYDISKNIKTSSDIVSKSMQNGMIKVEDLFKNIDKVNSVVDNAKEMMSQLSIEMKNVNEIVETINSISKQTNLLSLNASIEASRAGESGKGFAVVAQNIKVLAEASRNATKNIENILNGLYGKVNIIEKNIASGKQSVEQSKSSKSIVQNTLNDVISLMVNNSSDINVIEEKINELEEISKNIAANMEKLNNSTSNNEDSMKNVLYKIEEENNSIKSIINDIKNLDELAITLNNKLKNNNE